jgi:hypothetical protein
MHLYFSNSQIPELANLTRAQRKAVLKCALLAFYQEQPSKLWLGAPWLFGGASLGTLAGVALNAAAGLLHSRLLIISGCGITGAIIGIFIAGQLQTAQLRPYFRRVLEERRDEIARISKE